MVRLLGHDGRFDAAGLPNHLREEMLLRQIQIRNVRSIRSLDWELAESRPGAGWHVVVGDNGSGKSTFLRSAALALIGPRDALAYQTFVGRLAAQGGG